MSKYIYWVKKKRLVLVVLDIEEIRDKEQCNRFEGSEEVIEISTTVLPYTRCTLSFAFELLTSFNSVIGFAGHGQSVQPAMQTARPSFFGSRHCI